MTLQDEFVQLMEGEANLFAFSTADELVTHVRDEHAFSDDELDEIDCEFVTQWAESILLLKALS